MQKQVYFDYFYGEESEQFSYYRIPRLLVTGQQFKKKIVNTIDNLTAPEVGAEFSVTDNNGNVVDTIVTGENGIGTSKELPYGRSIASGMYRCGFPLIGTTSIF